MSEIIYNAPFRIAKECVLKKAKNGEIDVENLSKEEFKKIFFEEYDKAVEYLEWRPQVPKLSVMDL